MNANYDPLRNIQSLLDSIKVVTAADQETTIEAIRSELTNAIQQREDVRKKNDELACSQAEALVHSAEIISELEETKRELQEAYKAEAKAKRDSQRMIGFGQIIDESDNEIYLFECDSFDFIHVNQGARRNLGYTMQELRKMTPVDLKPEYSQEAFHEKLAPLRDSKVHTVHFETFHHRNDGTFYPVDVHVHRSIFEGRPVFVAVILDTTQRKNAEVEIRKLSATVEQSPASVVITDFNGNIEYVNPMFSQISGLSREEAIQQNWRQLLGRKLSSVRYQQMWLAVQRGEVWRGEVNSRNQSGEVVWELVSVSPIRNEAGEPTHFLATIEDITENKILLEKMEHLAFCDSLTGLPNRASILKTIQDALDDEPKGHFAILFLDFDRFKLINDSLGHKLGDELLIQVAERLRCCLGARENVISARLGGDEFVVFLSDMQDSGDAHAVAEELLDTFSESFQLCGNTVHSTASIGIVTNEHDHQSASDMLRAADLAMYAAKSKGRGCYVLFDNSMQEDANHRLELECDLRKAIRRGEFFLDYQPIVDLNSGALEGVEALARWRHPERGLVRPDEFIPVAEETRLILPIGEWILDEACRQLSEWKMNLGQLAPSCVHVNISRLQMFQSDLVDIVRQALERHGLSPDCLHLEVTESIFMQDTSAIVSTMMALRDLGVKIDMDDFGTGYSSLSCLHEFPIDVLKIDRSFINSTQNARDYIALLHAILTLADNLNLRVVAEGVETPEQLATLQAMGCEAGQGYLFSKPLAPEHLERFAVGRGRDRRANGTQVMDMQAFNPSTAAQAHDPLTS